MDPTIPMTPAGYERLVAELRQLKSVERPKIIQEVATARDHGDLRENAEYHAARDKHAFNEARISHLEGILSQVQVIDPTKLSGSKVAFGATVTLANADTGEEITYQIVGPEESDTAKGSISVSSPLAKQLMGRAEGDEVIVRTPGGQRTYEVLSVAFK